MTNPNPNRGGEFSFSNHDKRRDYSSPNEYRMKIEISSFSGNLDIESSLNWSMKWRSSLTWFTPPRISMSSSWHTGSREEQPHGGTNYKSRGDAKVNHPDDMETHEATPTR